VATAIVGFVFVSLSVGIAGYGTIGAVVGRTLDAGIPGLTLVAVTSGDRAKAQAKLALLANQPPVVDATELAARCDVIVECAPPSFFADIARPALERGRTVLTVSGAAILQHPEIVELAGQKGGRLILATGALLGFDAVRAAAEGTIHSVRMVTRKPPDSLRTAKYVVENKISLDGLTEPLRLFQGSAREGAKRFPSNVNVAAALGLAGVGPDRTELEIWADPSKTRNCHRIVVDADSARLTLEIENVPTVENPGTGRITALSMIAALRALAAPFRVGT
jgi:aspartate dehydrogenase